MSSVRAVKNVWNRIIEDDKHYKDLSKVHIDLIQRMEKHPPRLPQLDMSEEEATDKLNKGIPLLENREKDIDLRFATALFTELCQWSGLGQAKSAFKRMRKKVSEEEIEGLLRSYCERDGSVVERLSVEHDLPVDVLHVLLRYCLLPTLNQYAEQFMEIRTFQHEEWSKEYCPVCGDEHGLAEFRGDEGSRHFRCLSCAADWTYRRIGCPYCDNRDHEQLFSLFIEGGKNKYQVDVCEVCQGYVKGLYKLDRSSVPMLLLDDFLTLHLDMLAVEKGYHKGQQQVEHVH